MKVTWDKFRDYGQKPDHNGSCESLLSLGFIPKVIGKPLEALKEWSDVIRFSFLKGNSVYIVEWNRRTKIIFSLKYLEKLSNLFCLKFTDSFKMSIKWFTSCVSYNFFGTLMSHEVFSIFLGPSTWVSLCVPLYLNLVKEWIMYYLFLFPINRAWYLVGISGMLVKLELLLKLILLWCQLVPI